MKKAIKLSSFQPQKNLPIAKLVNTREYKLGAKLIRYLKEKLQENEIRNYLLGRELNLNGFGIADVVLLEYQKGKHKNRSTNKLEPLRKTITVYEVKIKDWKKAIRQAYRYRYYAHKSIIIMPVENVSGLIKNLQTLKSLGIGVWTYDKKGDHFDLLYTPRKRKPFSEIANKKASSLLTQRLISQQAY